MINPISTNSIYRSKMPAKQTQGANITPPSFELSDYKTGQAILARNNISFRNLATPIEVTDKYNKKIEGKDHLDLPNLHIYEYPDTNLQVYINADENIITNPDSILDRPKTAILIENTDYNKHNFVYDKLIKFIMQERFPQIDSDNSIISCCWHYEDTPTIPIFNKTITDYSFTEQELDKAKEQLKNYLKSEEYQNESGKYIYEKNDLKTEDEILAEVNHINPTDLQIYYKNYLMHSNIKAFVTVSRDYFAKNKTEILKDLNRDLDFKFMASKEGEGIVPEFIPHKSKDMNINKNQEIVLKELKFPIKNADAKDSLIAEFTNLILNSIDDFDYQMQIDYFQLPLGLKNNVPIKYHNTLCTIKPKNSKDKNLSERFKGDLDKICNEDLTEELGGVKNYYKERLKTTFTGERLDLIKNFELISYQDSVFNIYETIDSITQEDIKNYLRQYLIEQEPIMAENNS